MWSAQLVDSVVPVLGIVVICLSLFFLVGYIVTRSERTRPAVIIASLAPILVALPAVLYAVFGA
ncbi:hypothetical protein [Sphaerisporangium sp. TRM90804]|uniref:hypothetical protein n=1 Tax=Sphaerisporangium sp. TRM90804 TaxID=3031113 RepID=UPI00244A65FB|nr:hypothetical protein [Sphaerisporangium sp. TRM90804]MDH2424935.1 hypothetical protein [Sphaerisporangium sp. TRM90804]